MKISLPRKIKVFGSTIKLDSQSNMIDSDGVTKLLGYFKDSDDMIYINSDSSAQVQRRTLMHEIMHVYLNRAGLSQTLSRKDEEALCYLTESMVELFQQPELIKFLGSKKNG